MVEKRYAGGDEAPRSKLYHARVARHVALLGRALADRRVVDRHPDDLGGFHGIN